MEMCFLAFWPRRAKSGTVKFKGWSCCSLYNAAMSVCTRRNPSPSQGIVGWICFWRYFGLWQFLRLCLAFGHRQQKTLGHQNGCGLSRSQYAAVNYCKPTSVSTNFRFNQLYSNVWEVKPILPRSIICGVIISWNWLNIAEKWQLSSLLRVFIGF